MNKKVSLFIMAGVMLMTLTGCTTPSTSQEVKTIKVGVIAPISGPAANYGADAINAYRFVVKKRNASHPKLQIQLVTEDGKCDGKDATSAAQKLISVDGVQVIVGGFCSAETIAAGAIAQPSKVVMISPVSSSPEIAKIGDYIFRFYNDAYVTKKLANHIANLGAKKIFVLAENTDVSVGFLEGLKSNFSGIIESQMFQRDEKDFQMIAKQLKSKLDPSDFLIFLPSSDTSTIGIVDAFSKEGILALMKGRIASNEIVNSETSYKALGTKMDGIKTTQLVNLGALPTSANALVEELKKQFTINAEPLWTVLEAEAMSITLDAIAQAGNDGTAIKNYFTSFSATNLRKGYFGDYYFNPDRDAHGLDFLVYEIKDGKLVNGK